MNQEVKMPLVSINRHRLKTDGTGVTTLVGAYGCPLSCKYCINPHCWHPDSLAKCRKVTPKELYEELKIDNLYFLATNGGVTFGGGESLLHADFIKEFRKECGEEWNITLETSLNVPMKNLETVLPVATDYIVDIKDMNPERYKAYTGLDNDRVIENLKLLVNKVEKEHMIIRVPLIPDFNTKEDVERSVVRLKEMGIENIEVFSYVIRDESHKMK